MRTVNGSFPFSAQTIALADLWTVTMQNGVVYRWTSWESSLTYGSTWIGGVGAPILKRGSTHLIMGIEVDSMDVTVESGDSFMLGSVLLTQAAAAKAFDGCAIKLERAYMLIPGIVQCTVHLFEGLVSEVVPSHSEVNLKVTGFTERLNQSWPRNYWATTCQHKLYSIGCGQLESAFQTTTGMSGGTQFGFNATTGKASGYYDLGKATFIGGGNDGLMMGIKSQVGTAFTLVGKLPYAASGSVILVPGCDKTQSTCSSKYSNLVHFKGCPYIPKPETAR